VAAAMTAPPAEQLPFQMNEARVVGPPIHQTGMVDDRPMRQIGQAASTRCRRRKSSSRKAYLGGTVGILDPAFGIRSA
jgi:hypothetical protein